MLTEADIEQITRRVVIAYRPVAVGIFGSYATGTATPRSDLDLLVIRDPAGAVHADERAVRRLLFDVLHPLDVQVFTPAEFEESAPEYQSFAWIIARHARLYHWSPSADYLLPPLTERSSMSTSKR
jgi:uncharacterized protein